MEVFAAFLNGIDNPEHQSRIEEVLEWVSKKYPNLVPTMKWNQPMFTDHGTYIIGFSVSKKHIAIAPEQAGINQFADEIAQAGYDHTKEIIRFKWGSPFDYSLLEKMIDFNLLDKENCTTFWR